MASTNGCQGGFSCIYMGLAVRGISKPVGIGGAPESGGSQDAVHGSVMYASFLTLSYIWSFVLRPQGGGGGIQPELLWPGALDKNMLVSVSVPLMLSDTPGQALPPYSHGHPYQRRFLAPLPLIYFYPYFYFGGRAEDRVFQ